MKQEIWDRRFLELAKSISVWSEDLSTKLGSILTVDNTIVSTGYNGFPRKVRHLAERTERPTKYIYTEHAERNCIYNAAACGISTAGATLYMHSPIPGPPCGDCARAIIQAGIYRVVTWAGDFAQAASAGGWRETMLASVQMFAEAEVIWDQIPIYGG